MYASKDSSSQIIRNTPGHHSHSKHSSGDWSRRLQNLLPGRPSVDMDRSKNQSWPIVPQDVPHTSGPPAVYFGSAERRRGTSLQQFPQTRQSIPLYSNHSTPVYSREHTPVHSRDSMPVHSRQPSYEGLYMKGRKSVDESYGMNRSSSAMTRSRSSNKEVRFGDARYIPDQDPITTGPLRPNRLLRASSPISVNFLHNFKYTDRFIVDTPNFDDRRLDEPAFCDVPIRSVRLLFQDWNEEIIVSSSSTSHSRFTSSMLTMWDILLAINRHLGEGISSSTWYGVSADSYTRANEKRVQRGGRKLRRIDCLRDGAWFAGLMCVGEGRGGDGGKWLVMFD